MPNIVTNFATNIVTNTIPTDKSLHDLAHALHSLQTTEGCAQFLCDLCTPAEISAMTGRWQAAKLLQEGIPYRKINELTGVSTATITRVARFLAAGSGGYRLALDGQRQLETKE